MKKFEKKLFYKRRLNKKRWKMEGKWKGKASQIRGGDRKMGKNWS
jgi:hypothetical protein